VHNATLAFRVDHRALNVGQPLPSVAADSDPGG
jgi:hypothetical protein